MLHAPQPLQILVVEDNKGDFVLLREMFHDVSLRRPALPFEYRLIHASNFRSAIDILGEQRVDAVLLDLSLPDAFGIDTYYSMRAICRDTPIIVLTSNDDHITARAALQAGAQDYLLKGHVSGVTLVRSIQYAIERNRLIAELQSLQLAAVRANQGKNEFLLNMGTELGECVRQIRATALKGLSGINGDPRTALGHIAEFSTHLEAVTNAMFDFSQLESKKLELQPKEFELEPFLNNMWQSVEMRLWKRGIPGICKVAEGTPRSIVADGEQLGRIIQCLVENAMHWSDHGGGVFLYVEPYLNGGLKADHIHFSLSISGSAVGLEQHRLIFESLAQRDVAVVKKLGVFGLLLAVSARLVEHMRGQVWLKSTPGQGGAFHFTLPLACH